MYSVAPQEVHGRVFNRKECMWIHSRVFHCYKECMKSWQNIAPQ